MQHHQTGDRSTPTRATGGLLIWTLAWVATVALARFGPDHLWDSRPVVSWLAIGANIAVGLGLIIANARWLRAIDELQRKLTLDAMGVTLGTGLVAGLAYVTMSRADLIASDAEIGPLLILMGVVYILAIAVGNLRYR